MSKKKHVRRAFTLVSWYYLMLHGAKTSKIVMPKRLTLLYPFLFALYPGLALLAHNLSEMNFSDSFRSLALSLFIASISVVISKIYFRDWPRAALLATIFLVLFFIYGHVYSLLRDTTFLGVLIFRHRVLGLLWLGLFFGGFWGVKQKLLQPNKLAPTLTFIAIVALIVPIWETADFQSSASGLEEANTVLQETIARLPGADDDQNLPDIYYIILDGYSRDDYLLEYFDYDNSPFLDFLAEQGFFVAQCSQSNYAQSIFSLTSALNMNYIESIYEASYSSDYQANRYKQGLYNLLKHSQVREFLEQQGYSTIAFETGDAFSEIVDADYYYSLETKSFWGRALEGLNEFEVLFIRSTGLSFLTAVSPVIAANLLPDLDFPNKLHRERILFAFDTLERIPANGTRKFVFAHIVSPHKPFVFGPNGEVLEWIPGFKTGYPNQINYLNIRVKEVIESILEQSESPPIIILQADHGARQYVGEEGRMAILNAFYFPEDAQSVVYDTISPVNTFRVVFNEYFGQDYDLLADEGLYSSYLYPLDYRLIPQTGERCQ